MDYNVYLCRMKNSNITHIGLGIVFYTLFSMNTTTTTQVDEVEKVSFEREQQVTQELNFKTKLKNAIRVVATMYNAVEGQCDADPFVTACMYKINPHKASEQRYIAVSRDLLKQNGGKLVYGQKVKLVGCGHKNGIYTVADTMNKRFRNKIDILETQGTPLYKFNHVKIIVI